MSSTTRDPLSVEARRYVKSHDRPQNLERIKKFIVGQIVPAPASERRALFQILAKTMPAGMTFLQQDWLCADFKRFFCFLPNRLYEAFAASLPPSIEYPLLDKHRDDIKQFVLYELADIKDYPIKIIAAMARLFEGSLADRSDHREAQVCLFYIFQCLIKQSNAGAWITDLADSYLKRDYAKIEVLAINTPSGELTRFLQIGPPTDENFIEETLELRARVFPEEDDTSDEENVSGDDTSEDEPSSLEDDDTLTSTPVNVPIWLKLSVITQRGPKVPRPLFYDPDLRASSILNSLRNEYLDIFDLRDALGHKAVQYSKMVADMTGPYSSLHLLSLRETADIVDRMLPWDEDELSIDVVSGLSGVLKTAKAAIQDIEERLFKVEKYIVSQEVRLIAAGNKFKARASRYERCRHRYHLDWLRQSRSNVTSTPLPTSTDPSKEEVDPCPICYESVEREDVDFACQIVAARHCCKRVFHTDCLLLWLFEKVDSEDSEMTCPWCRSEMDLDLLGELMEAGVRALRCL
ncbi:hypothetical protein H2200_006226 [Cladophialophora chaetospira]|uniref:RING-type domain-containing protein n=1 Tax=Cladophialophora chaetospira TaxID=386627 RepID=A0AA39CJ66_9EURO|nr:hypothetical protein H2200_006226 [Cladophialophora chaetospira]